MLPEDHSSETSKAFSRRMEPYKRLLISLLLPLALYAVALAGFYLWIHPPRSLPEQIIVFIRHFCLAGLTLQLLILALWISRPNLSYLRAASVGFLFAATISILLTIDSGKSTAPHEMQAAEFQVPAYTTQRPNTFSNLFYVLIVERPALLGLALLALGGLGASVYYIFRLLMPVEYTGSGIQIRLPGQSVYYLPIYPQVRWQKTGIELRQGERISVEIYGWASPGGLHGLKEWEEFTDRLVLYEKIHFFSDLELTTDETDWLEEHDRESLDRYNKKERPVVPEEKWPTWRPAWPFTGPEGYPKDFYKDRLGVLRAHSLYKEAEFYKRDPLLTVQGCTHLQVFGTILRPGEEPKSTRMGHPAYNWGNPSDREQLLCLSSMSYPIEVECPRSGYLWTVINDVDEARWDNVGLFFMKLTRRSWL